MSGASFSSALATEQSLQIGFDEAKLSADPARASFLYDGYAPLILPSGLQLGVQTVKAPLYTAGEPPVIDIIIERGRLLGVINPELLSSVDVATADDGRYDAVTPAVAELFSNGFEGALLNSIRPTANGAVAQLTLSPYQIDSSGNVYSITGITLKISSLSAVEIGELQFGPSLRSPLLSSGGLLHPPTSTVTYLIITNKTLEPQMKRLADYKNATGVPTAVELIEDILAVYSGVDNAEALRNSLKDFYAEGVTHVMLAGDENVVPIRHTYYYNTSSMPLVENMMVTDLYFADLSGDWDTDGDGIWGEPTQDTPDLTPELHVGRLPISRPEQAKNYVDKLIVYETDPGFGDASYLRKTVIYSSDQMRDFSNGGQHAIIASAMPDYYLVDTARTTELPDGSSSAPTNDNAAETITTLDEGFGVVNIIAHGRHDGFAVRTTNYNDWPKSYMLSVGGVGAHGSLDQLAANAKIGLYIALSCDLGGFDMDAPPFAATTPSFVESVVSTEMSGAVGMVGYSRWGWVYSSYRLHESFLKHLYGDADGDPIVAMNLSSEEFPYYRDLIYGQNYYGDPTVQIHLDIPQAISLTLSSENWVDNSIAINVSSKGSASRGAAVAGARVILSADGVVLAVSTTDASGNANLAHEFQLGVNYTIATHPAGALVQMQQFTPRIATDVDNDDEPLLPQSFSLKQNYPNPFNPSTTIEWDLPRSSQVSYRVINILGRTVAQDNLGRLPAGRHSLRWEAHNQQGSPVASGVYFFQLVTEDNVASQKMTLLK
jgi:Peptidase family C25/FlgD Ig-like domain